MKRNLISIVWTVAAILAGILLYLSFHFFLKKKNSSRTNVNGNQLHATPMATAAAASVIRPLSQNYEVFLNFRGTDTRKTFADHLYHSLMDVRVGVFRDNEEIYVSEEIHSNLLAAIQTSKISVPIISPNYASSKWCLLELVQILKCRETLGQIVVPIFYHVAPSDVRDQKGSFGKPFSSHKKYYDSEIVQEWKNALKKVASLKAFELNNNVDGYEGKLIKRVVEKILADLKKTTVVVPEYLVGVEEQAEKIMKTINEKSFNDSQVVLIHGMGGIGKTTLAKFLYNQLTRHFQFCSFLESVRETPMQQLQKQLISNILKKEWPQEIYHANEGTCIIKNTLKGTRVFLVLDDVDNGEQLNALIGRHEWFRPGSIIIITTRSRDVLKSWHVTLVYQLRELDFDQSFQLFCGHALQGDDSRFDEFETIAQDIVSTTGGLPLAIVAIGSFLFGKDIHLWKETLRKLKRIPDDEVQLKLKISFDALTYEQKQIFLDIACLFSTMHEFDYFMHMWDDCEYYPQTGIEVLKSLSLIKMGFRNELIMHDQVKLLGREIVRQQSRDLPGKRSILWNQEEACKVMKTNQGTEQIQILNLALDKRSEEIHFTSKQFKKLTKLRLLKMSNANLVGNFKNCFSSLRWLEWRRCPSNFMATGFHPTNLVVLNLSYSKITEEWGGWSEMKYAEKLKVLVLRWCYHLKATPDFSAFKELEILDLSYCKSLSKINPSICRMTKTLKTLTVEGCEELEVLPEEIGMMEELMKFDLGGTLIREVHIVEGFMKKLEFLSVKHCKKLNWLPDSIGSLKKLQYLSINGCLPLMIIPKLIGKLQALSQLDLRYTNIEELPETIGCLSNLEVFIISGTPIKQLPAAIGMLKRLRYFDAKAVHGLTELPKEIGELTNLAQMYLEGAPLSGLPNLPSGLIQLSFSGSSMESVQNLSYLTNLYSLHIQDMGVTLELPSRLRELSLHGCQTLCTLPNFSYLKHLSTLCLVGWTELMEINALEELKSLTELSIYDCRKISELSGMGNSLSRLFLSSCDGLKCLPDFSNFKNLNEFRVVECNSIVEIPGLDTVECLQVLDIHDCSSLEGIGDLSYLTRLHEVRIGNCPKIRDNCSSMH